MFDKEQLVPSDSMKFPFLKLPFRVAQKHRPSGPCFDKIGAKRYFSADFAEVTLRSLIYLASDGLLELLQMVTFVRLDICSF